MADLPLSGVSLIVQNAAKATRDINAFTDAMRKEVKVSNDVAKASSSTSKVTSALTKDFSKMGSELASRIPIIGKFSNLLGTIGTSGTTAAAGANAAAAGTTALGAGMTAALPVIGAVTVAIGAATLGFIAFWKTGVRGAALSNTLEAFKNVVAGIEDTNTVLNGLRTATRGTVSDMELMRLTTQALQGQSKEFREVLLKTENGVTNLGKVLDITSRAARATGQSEEYIREKFINGLRLQSKLRLDDIGVTVNATEANEKYAKSIGKTAAALTDAEKKQAFLTEALSQLERIGAEAPINSLQDALARIGAVIQNTKDKIALLIQPIFEPIAKLFSGIISTITEGINNLIYFVAPVFKVIGAIITETFATAQAVVDMFFGGFAESAGTTTTYIIAAFQLAGQVIVEVIHLIGQGIRTALGFFQAAMKGIGGAIRQFFGITGDTVNLNINQLAFNLGKGGALIIGSFAAGILRGGTFVLQAVTEIAQIVADFLMGFSPPKKGVLSTIDTGGENVATAWVGGFLDGVTKSFGEVTQFVNDRLGVIASFSREQIESSLARLDLAIRPFKESLAIIKADMQAIAGFTDPALKILERQRQNLLKAFGRGDQGLDIEQLRTQDRQIQRIKEIKELGQDQIDQAELQLAIAESQQVQERTLLGIARDRLGKQEGIADAVKKASDAAAKAGGGGGGGAGAGEAAAGAGLGLGGGAIPDLLSNEAIDAAKAKIISTISGIAASAGAGISEGLAESGFGGALAGFQGQTGALGTQLSRIASSDPVKNIKEKFEGLKNAVSTPITEFKDAFEETFNNLFGDNGTITKLLDDIRNKFNEIFVNSDSPIQTAISAVQSFKTDGIDPVFKALFGSEGTITGFLNDVKAKLDEVFGGSDNPLETAITKLDEIKTTVQEVLTGAFDVDIAAAAQTIYDTITGVFDEAKNLIANLTTSETITNIRNEIKGVMDGILDQIQIVDVDAIVSGFESVLTRIQSAIENFSSGAIEKGKDIANTIAGIFGGGGDEEETVTGRRGDQQTAQNLLAGLTVGLPEETRTQLQGIGEQITAAIALGINGEESITVITDALTALYETISTTFTSLFIGEESVVMLAQLGMMNFVTVMAEQLTLFQESVSTSMSAVDTLLRNMFINEGGIIPSLFPATQAVLDQIIGESGFMRLVNQGEGTLSGAVATLSDVLKNSIVRPFHRAAQAMADSVRNGLSNLVQGLSALLGELGISLPTIPPIYVEFPAYAKGTLVASGSFIAGERGAELITAKKNNPMSVFPNRATMALERIGAMMERPAPMPMYIGGAGGNSYSESNTNYTNSNNRNVTQNFRYSPTKLERAQMRAGSY